MLYDVLPDSKEIIIDKNTTYGLFAKTNDTVETLIYVKKGVEFNLLTVTTCTEGKTVIATDVVCEENTKVKIVCKNIASTNSKINFTSQITIPPTGKNVDADMDIKNYILTETGEINAKPNLVIDNKDVSCRHGCTMSTFDTNQIFYMNTRGIENTKEILLHGLIDSILNIFPAIKHLTFKRNIDNVQTLLSGI
tara:strand:+ start:263 stop:844 length:582 start_codon:yes stop_codon:yes gene_type:complete